MTLNSLWDLMIGTALTKNIYALKESYTKKTTTLAGMIMMISIMSEKLSTLLEVMIMMNGKIKEVTSMT